MKIDEAIREIENLKHENDILRLRIRLLIGNQEEYTKAKTKALESENKRLKQCILRTVIESGK